MRILLIANGIVDSKGGVSGGEMRLIEIARHWVRAGYDAHMMSGPGGVDLCSRLDLAVTPHVVGGVTAHSRVVIRRAHGIFVFSAASVAVAPPPGRDRECQRAAL